MSGQSTLTVQIRIMCSCPYGTAFVRYKRIVHILCRASQKCWNISDVQSLFLWKPWEMQIKDPASTRLSLVVLSTLLILGPPVSSVLSSMPSLFCSSHLWKPEVWDVWGLGPALLTRLSADFSFNSCPFDWTKFPCFLMWCLENWFSDWGSDWLTCWQS